MFKKHLSEAEKTYWNHFSFAFCAGWILMYAGITSIIAVLEALTETRE